MEFIGRFRAQAGQERLLANALQSLAGPTRAEAGCISFAAYRSQRDPLLFFVKSTWLDEAAFERHAEFPHTVTFVAKLEEILAEPAEFVRLEQIT